MSASETGRDHIPPRVFKQMTHLTKQMQKLDAMLSDVKLTNYKVRATQIADFLEKYIPDVAAMETQMKKYEKCFTTAESEKRALKKKNADLSEALKKSQQESTLKKIQELRLQNDYKYAAVLDIDNLPEVKPTGDGTGNVTVNDSDKNFTDSCIDSEKTA